MGRPMLALCLLAALAAMAQDAPPVAAVLFVEQPTAEVLALKVLLIAGAPPEGDVRFNLTLSGPAGQMQALAAQAPRTGWTPDGLQVLRFDPVTLDVQADSEIVVAGSPAGTPQQPLGTLVRSEGGQVQLRRACPALAEGQTAIVALAAAEQVGPRRFTVKVAYLNCGARLDRDYWAFLHFEPEPTGESLAVTSEMGLYPAGKPTDASLWTEDEVTVVTFGPYELPADLAEPLYLRAGLYDHGGDGGRVRLAASAEDSRVLVGRFVSRDGSVAFVRLAAEEAGQ